MSTLSYSTEAERRHRAVRVLAAHARDAEELTALLDMLGLTAAEGRFSPAEVADAARVACRHASETERNLATVLLADVAQEFPHRQGLLAWS